MKSVKENRPKQSRVVDIASNRNLLKPKVNEDKENFLIEGNEIVMRKCIGLANQINGGIIQRTVWDLDENKLKQHIGGEYNASSNSLVGGHSKKVMKEFHGENVSITNENGGGGGGIFNSCWLLKDKNASSKNSTFFPNNWSWDTIKKQIKESSFTSESRGTNHHLKSGIKKTKSGIYIKKSGDTIYPVKVADAFT